MTNHTPGPWFLRHGKIYGRDGFSVVADKIEFHTNPVDREYIGNANLIAAAPELLWALKSIVDGPAISDPAHTEYARTAIALAEGRI